MYMQAEQTAFSCKPYMLLQHCVVHDEMSNHQLALWV